MLHIALPEFTLLQPAGSGFRYLHKIFETSSLEMFFWINTFFKAGIKEESLRRSDNLEKKVFWGAGIVIKQSRRYILKASEVPAPDLTFVCLLRSRRAAGLFRLRDIQKSAHPKGD